MSSRLRGLQADVKGLMLQEDIERLLRNGEPLSIGQMAARLDEAAGRIVYDDSEIRIALESMVRSGRVRVLPWRTKLGSKMYAARL